MLLNAEEPGRATDWRLVSGLARRLRRDGEIALGFVFVERHRDTDSAYAPVCVFTSAGWGARSPMSRRIGRTSPNITTAVMTNTAVTVPNSVTSGVVLKNP